MLLTALKYWKPLLVLGMVFVSFVVGVSYGRGELESDYMKAAITQATKIKELTDKLTKEQQDIANGTAVKVRTVYVEKDATGCLDATAPDRVLGALGYNPGN